jgi:hypothetical protein
MFQPAEPIDKRRLILSEVEMTNVYLHMRQVWAWAARSPRRLHAFILAGQLGPAPSYQPNC